MSGGRVRLSCAPCGEEPQGAHFYSPAKNARLFNSCPPCENPTKILRLFAGALFGREPSGARREGCKGWCRACMTTLPSALFNRLPWSRRRKERRRQRSRFLPTMAKTSVRHARTPHRGDAHNARLTPLHRGGEGGCGVEPLMSSQHAYFLTSSRTRNEVEWRDPLTSDGARGDSSIGCFAPMGLVRRFVEMLLQAGISPRVGRNDG